MTILSATIEILLPCFVHVALGLLLSAGALIHVALHWKWTQNAFSRFGRLPSQVRTNFLLNLGLLLAYSAAGSMGLFARSLIGLGPLRHVVLVVGVLLLQTIHLARHWKWISATTQKFLASA